MDALHIDKRENQYKKIGHEIGRREINEVTLG
jgi:hypothetical protein